MPFFSTPALVKDIQSESVYVSQPYTRLSRVGNRALFYGCDPALGTALWISDDSPQAMHLLKVLNPRATKAPEFTFYPMDAQGRTFFSAEDAAYGRSLWVTDGTEEGTQRLTHQLTNLSWVNPRNVVAFQDGVRFWGATDESFNSLWISDGTPKGTYPLVSDATSYQVQGVQEGHGGLYFFIVPSYGYTGGTQLWWSDGQPQNFTLMKTFPDDIPGEAQGVYILQIDEEQMYFSVHTAADGWELWITEGTPESTRRVKEIAPGKNGSDPDFFINLGRRMLFTATKTTTGRELYATDGTAKGTVMLKNIGKGRRDGNPVFIAQAGDQVYFSAQITDGNDRELCVTDGTAKGTFIVSDQLSLSTSKPILLGRHGEEAYFTCGEALWVVGGTHTVPLNVSALNPETAFKNARHFVSSDTGFAFDILTSKNIWPYAIDSHIWISDGPATDLRPLLTLSGSIKSLAKVGPFLGISTGTSTEDSLQVHHLATGTTETILTVTANQDLTWGREISPGHITFKLESEYWVTNGTPEGTFKLGSSPGIEYLEGHAWYASRASGADAMLTWWKTDGTPAGTVPVHRLPAPNADSNPRYLKTYDGEIYFSADDGTHGQELWHTDGSEAGTAMVTDIVPGVGSSGPILLGEYAGLLYFTATTPAHGRELWRTDGTEAGTFMLRDIRPDTLTYPITSTLVEAGGKVYFIAYLGSGSGAYQLWVTDGTEAGTLKVKDQLSTYFPLVAYQDRIAFYHSGLWLTDGTTAGTVLQSSGSAYKFTVMDGQLFWMKDFNLMRSTSTPGSLTNLGSVRSNSITLLPRPPAAGDVVSPGSWVLFIRGTDGLYRHTSGDSGVTLIAPSDGGNLWLCGSTLIYSDGGKLWSSNGQANAQTQVIEEDIQSILTTTTERIYYTRTNHWGKLELESICPDGSGRVLLTTGAKNETFKIAHVEEGRVFFTLGGWLWETAGTPATTRRVSGGLVSTTLGAFSFASLQDQLYLPLTHPEAGQELHRLTMPAQPHLSVTTPGGAELAVGESALIELPVSIVGQTSTRTLTLRNPGLLPLTDIAFTSPNLGAFTLSPSTLPSLAPGASLTVELTITPLSPGTHEAEVTLTAQGASGFTHSLSLHGRALGPEDAAEVVVPPQSQLVLLGQPATFTAELLTPGGVQSSSWERTPGTALSETSATLTLAPTQVEDIGTYTYHAKTPMGEVVPSSADLGLILPTSVEPIFVPSHYSIQLPCYAQSPEGSYLTYQWLYQKRPLLSATRITGSQSPTLLIQDFRESDAGDYECLVTMHAPDRSVSLSHGVTTLRLMEPPDIRQAGWQLQFFVGEEVHYQLPLTFPADGFVSRGLPPGLKLGPTGLITGRPTRALPMDPETEMSRPYQVLMAGRNAAGYSEVYQIEITILPISTPGAYVGLLPRHPDLAGGKNLGSRVQLTIATAGKFSGQLTHGGKVYRFTAPKYPMSPPPVAYGIGYEIPISLGRGQPTLTLAIIAYGGAEFDATLTDSLGHVCEGTMGRQRRAIEFSDEPGSYSVRVVPELDPFIDPRFPYGISHLVLKESKSGTVSWKGKLADGTPIIGSTLRVAPYSHDHPKIFIHQPLYKATGSVHGEIILTTRIYGPHQPSGELSWFKAPQPGSRTYPEGIPLHNLQPTGDQTFKLEKDQTFWGLNDSGYPLQLTFTGEGLPEEGLVQRAGITHKSGIRLSPENEALKSFSLNLTTRAFKGTFHMLAPASDKPIAIPFEGVFTDYEGGGYFLIPEVAEDGTLNPKTAPLHSGKAHIEPMP